MNITSIRTEVLKSVDAILSDRSTISREAKRLEKLPDSILPARWYEKHLQSQVLDTIVA